MVTVASYCCKAGRIGAGKCLWVRAEREGGELIKSRAQEKDTLTHTVMISLWRWYYVVVRWMKGEANMYGAPTQYCCCCGVTLEMQCREGRRQAQSSAA